MKSFQAVIIAALAISTAAINEPVASPTAAIKRELAEYERQLGTDVTGTPTANPGRPTDRPDGSYSMYYGYRSGKAGKGSKGGSSKGSKSKGSKSKGSKNGSYGSYGYGSGKAGKSSGKSGKGSGSYGYSYNHSKGSKTSSKGSKGGSYFSY